MTREGVLRLSHDVDSVEFDIEQIPFSVDATLPASALGVLTPLKASDDIFILKTI